MVFKVNLIFYDYNIDKLGFKANKTVINENESVNFIEGIYIDPWPSEITWTFTGATTITSNEENHVIKFVKQDLYDVTLTVKDNVCGINESITKVINTDESAMCDCVITSAAFIGTVPCSAKPFGKSNR